jgi:hypothetical protein
MLPKTVLSPVKIVRPLGVNITAVNYLAWSKFEIKRYNMGFQASDEATHSLLDVPQG